MDGSRPTREEPALRLLFDRGTIVVVAPEGTTQADLDLPGVVWDERTRVFRAPAWCAEELRRVLRERLRPFRDHLRGPGPPSSPWETFTIRPYQEAALSAWRLAQCRGVVVLPTGAGKTRLAFAAMARTRLRTLCLVPTRVLLHQWRRELARFYRGPIGCLGDGHRDIAAVTVATIESAYRHMPRIGNRFELIVADEAHHFGCGVRDEILEMATAAARLGLTATPRRDEPAASRLAGLLGTTVFEMAVAELSGTFLAPLDLHVLELELTPEERRAHDVDMRAFWELHARFRELSPGGRWDEFVRAASRTPEGREALAAWRRARRLLSFTRAKSQALGELLARHRDARVLVFTADNETAYAVARRHLIMPFTCDIARKERDEVLRRFRDGELRALVSAQVLNEGVDVPDADVAIVVGGALGEREHVQRVGRVLRPVEGKRAIVYELVMRETAEARRACKRRAALGCFAPR